MIRKHDNAIIGKCSKLLENTGYFEFILCGVYVRPLWKESYSIMLFKYFEFFVVLPITEKVVFLKHFIILGYLSILVSVFFYFIF